MIIELAVIFRDVFTKSVLKAKTESKQHFGAISVRRWQTTDKGSGIGFTWKLHLLNFTSMY